MIKRWLHLLAALGVVMSIVVLGTTAHAVTVEDCDWRASAHAIVEPWDANTRTFANGDIRIALTDVIEPAAGAFHVVVLSPPYDELGGRQCRVVSASGSVGFSGMDFSNLTSDYDPASGLTLRAPVQMFVPSTGGFTPRTLSLTINQATGAINAQLLGGK